MSTLELLAVREGARRAAARDEQHLSDAKDRVMAEYRRSEEYKSDLAELLRPSLEQTFAQVHDYRQLITQVIQHVNVFLEIRFPKLSLDDQLNQVDENIRSIYWAARLMEFKLESALFVANPDRIDHPQSKRVFRLHGAIHKYLQIYKPLLEASNLKLRVIGESHGNLMENPDAIGVIPQAFLDNAIKYAPPSSEVFVTFAETEDVIRVEVESEGPRIANSEGAKIFELFFRGAAAAASGEEGTGFGLGLAQMVADRVGAKLSYRQGKDPLPSGFYKTTFITVFEKPIKGEGPQGS